MDRFFFYTQNKKAIIISLSLYRNLELEKASCITSRIVCVHISRRGVRGRWGWKFLTPNLIFGTPLCGDSMCATFFVFIWSHTQLCTHMHTHTLTYIHTHIRPQWIALLGFKMKKKKSKYISYISYIYKF